VSAVAWPLERHGAGRALGRRLWRELRAVRMRLWDRRRYRRLVLEWVDGDLPLVVLPDVFNPKLLRSGEFLVHQLRRQPALLPAHGGRVLDLGCGSGVGALVAARAGCRVVAVDINPAAVRCTRINALLNGLDGQVEVRGGDLFEPVQGERFETILFNPPYYRGVPRDALDWAWRAPDVVERFAAGLAAHLAPGGSALLVLSSDGEAASFLRALAERGFSAQTVAAHDFRNEQMWISRIVRQQAAVPPEYAAAAPVLPSASERC
jgi:HemK-related putative methylase